MLYAVHFPNYRFRDIHIGIIVFTVSNVGVICTHIPTHTPKWDDTTRPSSRESGGGGDQAGASDWGGKNKAISSGWGGKNQASSGGDWGGRNNQGGGNKNMDLTHPGKSIGSISMADNLVDRVI